MIPESLLHADYIFSEDQELFELNEIYVREISNLVSFFKQVDGQEWFLVKSPKMCVNIVTKFYAPHPL